MTAFLEARGVYKSYGRPPRPVLRDIDLSLPRGSIWGLLGESGSGKARSPGCSSVWNAPMPGRFCWKECRSDAGDPGIPEA